MSDMKCPFCQQELRKIHPTYVICDNCRITGEDKLWQELIRTKELLEIESAEHSMCHTQMLKTTEKLDRTRKALEVAFSQLKKTRDCIENCRYQETNYFLVDSKDVSIILDETNEALEQITALEQKE